MLCQARGPSSAINSRSAVSSRIWYDCRGCATALTASSRGGEHAKDTKLGREVAILVAGQGWL